MASTLSTSSALIAGAVASDQSLFFEALRDPGYAAFVGYRDLRASTSRRARRSPLLSFGVASAHQHQFRHELVRVHVRSRRRGVRVNALMLGPIETRSRTPCSRIGKQERAQRFIH
jgi:hypothetical protein